MIEAALESPLADRDAAVLDSEERWFVLEVPREQAIMEHFGCFAIRHYQRPDIFIDDPAALGCEPLLAKWLHRQHVQCQAARSIRRLWD